MRRRTLALAAGAGLALLALSQAGRWLVVDDPQPADAIVAVAGEESARPDTALALLRRGYAPRLFLSVDDREIYGTDKGDLARRWAAAQPEAARILVCSNDVDSTRDEAVALRACLPPDARRLLLVTSDFHTRRARSVFARELPGRTVFVASATDPDELRHWWRNRALAKRLLQEWAKLFWWRAVDYWRRA